MRLSTEKKLLTVRVGFFSLREKAPTKQKVTAIVGHFSRRWVIFGSNFCVSEKRDRKWSEKKGFEIDIFRFC